MYTYLSKLTRIDRIQASVLGPTSFILVRGESERMGVTSWHLKGHGDIVEYDYNEHHGLQSLGSRPVCAEACQNQC